MRRILSSLMTLAFLAAVGAGPAVAMDKMTGSTMHSSSSMMKSTKCAKGMTWVKGYTNKMTGKKVAGYCRKSKTAGSTPKM